MDVFVKLICVVAMVTACQATCMEKASIRGYCLRGHVIASRNTTEIRECVRACDENLQCRSINFLTSEKKCELNDANRFSYPDDYKNLGRGYVYGDSLRAYNSCAEVKLADPGAKSGYYKIFLRTKTVQVYCDMEKYGGGWTLAVGISATDNEHLQRIENNCENLELCVPFVTTTVPSCKLADVDIHWLASAEGIFRVDDLDNPHGVNTVFFKIPSGASNFNSACFGERCPRIIASHSFPYSWESNCKGTDMGYRITATTYTRVFDTRDDSECGPAWVSSQYGSKRILYAYTNGVNRGLYPDRQGWLFVK